MMGVMGSTGERETNILQVLFTVMWKLAKGDPFAEKMLTAAVEGYSQQMAEINRRPG